MKEIVSYYYNLMVDNIEESDGKYHFVYQNTDYFFIYYNRSLNELDDIIKCTNDIQAKGFETSKIIMNIDNSYITQVDNLNYVLISVNNKYEIFDIFDIIDNNKKLVLRNEYSSLYRNDWEKLWSEKVDYFEYQIRELGLNKEVIKNSFSYYIGLAENAISYIHYANTTMDKSSNLVLSHRRVYYPNYKLNYYNPLSFIFDIDVRDVAEYLKSSFFKVGISETILDLRSYLSIQKIDNYSAHMLYARLLYPTYYFDLYESIMNKDHNEDDLVEIIKQVDNYELFLKKAYFEISKYAPLAKIDWLIN